GSVLFEFAGRGAVGVVILLVVYVLSFGPAIMLWRNSKVRPGVVTIYEPLGYAALAVPQLKRFLEWYARDVWKSPVIIRSETETRGPREPTIVGARAPK